MWGGEFHLINYHSLCIPTHTQYTPISAYTCEYCYYRSGITVQDVEWFQSNLLLFISLLVTFLSIIVVGLLFLYHSYLMLTGQTTWEQASRYRIYYLKDLPDLTNPFDEGCICNSISFLLHTSTRDWEVLYLTRTSSRVIQR